MDTGETSEAIAVAELRRRGHSILLPHGTNHRYDLVIDAGGRFVRVQVKTGRYREGVIKFGAISTRANMQTIHRRGYDGREIDAFLIVCPEINGVYWIPIEDAPPGQSILRIDPAGNNQQKKIRWAADYELPPPERLKV